MSTVECRDEYSEENSYVYSEEHRDEYSDAVYEIHFPAHELGRNDVNLLLI